MRRLKGSNGNPDLDRARCCRFGGNWPVFISKDNPPAAEKVGSKIIREAENIAAFPQRLVLSICGRLPNRCLGCFGQRNGRRTFAQKVKSDARHPVCWMGDDRRRCINCHLPELKRCDHPLFGVGPRQRSSSCCDEAPL
jgi:hypothetical protein